MCDSTYGVSGAKWQYAARAAVLTLLASFGGGAMGIAHSVVTRKEHFDIMDIINGVLGSLVSITGKKKRRTLEFRANLTVLFMANMIHL